MLSAICLNLDLSKILLSSNELSTLFPADGSYVSLYWDILPCIYIEEKEKKKLAPF